jgi:glucarate dehydratase
MRERGARGNERMKISDVRATTVAVPLEAPLRHANGAHWGRFVRTIVEVETDEGLVGLGEMGGGGESAEKAIYALKSYLLGHDPLQLEQLYWKICNPTASLYNNRAQMHAAIEFACIDLAGKRLGIRACDLLGGALREEIPFASYLFCRYRNPKTEVGGEETAADIVNAARDLKRKHGFRSHKLKGGVFSPDHDLNVYLALAAEFPEDSFRLDPNAAWSVEESIRIGRAIEHVRNDYYEDPCWGLEGMRRVRRFVNIPTATNTVVVNFEQLAACILTDAIDVILLDTTFWGGLRQAWMAGVVCQKFQRGISVHSSGELGIQLATMLHLGACLPNITFAADAHYHHLLDDIIVGGKMKYVDGKIALPTASGLGVELDRDKLQKYAELFRKEGGYAYDRDPKRPKWFAMVPETRFAQVAAVRRQKLTRNDRHRKNK